MLHYFLRGTWAALAIGIALPFPLLAEERDQANERKWEIYLGVFAPSVGSRVGINGEAITPPPIDVEDVLGVEDGKNVPWGGVRWDFVGRHSLEFEYFQLNRTGLRGFEGEEIGVGDFLVESGAILTELDFSLGRLTYGYRIIDGEKSWLRLEGGLHLADFSASLQLAGNICDLAAGEAPPCPTIDSPVDQSEDVTAPLPHFGASYEYHFTDVLTLRLQLIGFAIELDNIDGAITEIDADLVWRPWDNFGVGLGGRYFNVSVKGSEDRLNGEFDYEYYGPALYVIAMF